MLVLSQYAEERYAVDLIGDDAEGVGYLLKDRVTDFKLLRRRRPARRRRRVGARPDGRRPHARPAPPRRPARGPHPARARGARADGRGTLEQGHRRGAGRHPARGREARDRASSASSASAAAPRTTAACSRCSSSSEGDPGADERPRAARGLDLERPVERAHAVAEAAQAAAARRRPRRRSPSSRTSTTAQPFSRRTCDPRVRGAGVLGDVGQRLGDDEVGARSRPRSGAAPPARSRARPAPAPGSRATPSAASSPRWESTAGWMPDARSRSSPTAACALANALSTSSQRPVGVGGQPLARELQLDHQRHEPLLRAVVQVAPEPPALRVTRLHQPRARRAQRLQPRPQLDLQPRVLQRQRGGGARLDQQLRRLGQHVACRSAPTRRPS